LGTEKPEYLFPALVNLGERKREEGETALLDLGTILEEIRKLSPPPKTQYDLDVNRQLAERRKAIFEKEITCCHGKHSGEYCVECDRIVRS
jgi:hypothetical protein